MFTPVDVRSLQGVTDTRNLLQRHLEQPIDLVFWACPNMRKNGWRFNKETNSLTTRFDRGLTDSGKKAVARVLNLKEELLGLGWQIKSVTAMFATADAILLVDSPLEFPDIPVELSSAVSVVSTAKVVNFRYLMEWGMWRRTKPWKSVPSKFLATETQRLRNIPWNSVPDWSMNNWLERILAGYAQDGVWVNRRFKNPVIAGVESPGVPVLQNAALSKDKWIPVIQLV